MPGVYMVHCPNVFPLPALDVAQEGGRLVCLADQGGKFCAVVTPTSYARDARQATHRGTS